MIAVDMNKARDIVRDHLRAARTSKLAALDVEFARALEIGVDTSAIVAKKNELRDITRHSSIEAAETPEELLAVLAALVL